MNLFNWLQKKKKKKEVQLQVASLVSVKIKVISVGVGDMGSNLLSQHVLFYVITVKLHEKSIYRQNNESGKSVFRLIQQI